MEFIKHHFVFTVTLPNGAEHDFETESMSYRYAYSDLRVQYRIRFGGKKDSVKFSQCRVRLKEKRGVK